jgi:ASCH domain
MIALVVRQPWALQIVQGVKPIEFRSWRTNHRGRLAIVAGCRRPTRDECEEEGVDAAGLVCGAILGTVRVTGCRRAGDIYEWLLADPIEFAAPVAFRKGQLGLFTIDDALLPS